MNPYQSPSGVDYDCRFDPAWWLWRVCQALGLGLFYLAIALLVTAVVLAGVVVTWVFMSLVPFGFAKSFGIDLRKEWGGFAAIWTVNVGVFMLIFYDKKLDAYLHRIAGNNRQVIVRQVITPPPKR